MRRIAPVILTILLGAATAAAQAPEEGPHAMTIRGAPLAAALQQVVEHTGIDLVYDTAVAEGAHVYCSVRGATAEALLRCVLAGTGLDFVRSSSGAFVLIAARRQPAPPAALGGRVVDAVTGEPLPFAHVLLADAGTVTDADGYFAFGNVQAGWHRVAATYVGYEAGAATSVWLEPGARARLTIVLRPAATRLAPVVVDGLTQRLPSAGLGAQEYAPAASPPPSWLGTPDVMRGAAATLGVSAALPLADLHIQGGSTVEHVTRLDGVPVRDPVALGRYLGAFSPLAIGGVTVHKGGFAPRHGSHLAGAIDVRHRRDFEEAEAAVQVDAVSANALLTIPLNVAGGGAAMLAVRRSIWEVFRDPGTESLLRRANHVDPLLTGIWLDRAVAAADLRTLHQDPQVVFSDLHASIHLRPDAYSTLQGFIFRAGNYVAASHGASLDRPSPELSLLFDDVYDWRNWAGRVRYSRLIGARLVVGAQARGSLHTSSYQYDYAYEAVPAGGVAPAGRRGSYSAGAAHRLLEAGADVDATFSLAPGRDLEAGLGVDLVDATFTGAHAWVPRFGVAARQAHVSAFLQGRYAIGRRLSLEGGTRVTALPASGAAYAEPRLAARYDGSLAGTEGFAVRIASGVYRQFVNGYHFRSAGPASLIPELWFWLPAGGDLPPPRSAHLAVEGMVLLEGGWTVRAEAFGRRDSRILALDAAALGEGAEGATVAPAAMTAEVSGHAPGGGVALEWQRDAVMAAASYTFERSRRTRPRAPAGPTEAVPWEEPHRLAIDARAGLGAGLSLEAAARGVWGRSWGLRHAYYEYVNGDDVPGMEGQFAQPSARRLPALLLLDAKLAFAPPLAQGAWRLELGVANLLDRANVVDWSLDGGGDDARLVPRVLPGRRLTFSVRTSW